MRIVLWEAASVKKRFKLDCSLWGIKEKITGINQVKFLESP
jgi:hypothetical protein